LLRNTNLTTERIGWDVGYADPSAFRKVFQTIVGLSATNIASASLLPHGTKPRPGCASRV